MLKDTHVLSEILPEYENKNIAKFSKCNYVAITQQLLKPLGKSLKEANLHLDVPYLEAIPMNLCYITINQMKKRPSMDSTLREKKSQRWENI